MIGPLSEGDVSEMTGKRSGGAYQCRTRRFWDRG